MTDFLPRDIDRFGAMLDTMKRQLATLQQQVNVAVSQLAPWPVFAASAHLSVQKPATGALTLTTSIQDVPGCTTTFTVSGAHSIALVVGTFDVQPTTSSAGVNAVGQCLVDGVAQTSQAIWTDNGANSRCTVTQSWQAVLAAGQHTIKLGGLKVSALGSHMFNTGHTALNVLILDLV